MNFVLPCLYAALACAGFCVVLEVRRPGHIVSGAAAGAAGWLTYLLAGNTAEVWRFLLATVVVAALAELFARMFKTPATVFLIIGILPLVPGGGIYYAMEALINGDPALCGRHAIEALAAAGAIAVGSSLVSAVARMLPVRGRKN